jgi:outer membrane receptor protein involved in Fe transport
VGVRVDHYAFLSATRVSPRAGVSYDITPAWSVRASAGRYVQQPFFLFLTAFPGNRFLDPFRSDHVVLGTDVTRGSMRMTAEVYEKRYSRYPVSSDVASLSLANIGDTFAVREILFPLTSEGTGRSRGVELNIEQRASAARPFYGLVNVALSRARHAGADGVERPGSLDYPVVVNALGGYRLSPKWEVSIRLAYLSGRPVTPFDDELSTAQRRGVYDLARVNAERAPDYFRGDVRVDRTFLVGGQPLTVFAGVQNVTNRKNISGYTRDRRANTISTQEQLGLFPLLGLDWQF